jgi:endonuclease/exonuclease/phosphatase family metal-dependent hydrolase
MRRAILGALAGAALLLFLLPGGGARAALPTTPLDPVPLCGSEGSVAAQVAASKLRIASYNVLHTQTDDGDVTLDARIPLLADALAGARVDAAGLQEVANTANHGLVVQRLAAALVERTGVRWHWCWFQSNPHFPGEPDLQPGGGGGPLTEVMATQVRPGEARWSEGLAVLSRVPISESSAFRMPPRTYEGVACVPPDPIDCNAAAAFDSRQVLRARLATPSGPLDLYTTHLAHGLTPLSDLVTQRAHVNVALAYIAQTAAADSTPDVLTGDFNTDEGSDVYDDVTAAGFVDTFRSANPSALGNTSHQDALTDSPAPQVDHRIDYVFAKPGRCGLAVKSSEVIGATAAPFGDGLWVWPSDHYGVVSELRCARS